MKKSTGILLLLTWWALGLKGQNQVLHGNGISKSTLQSLPDFHALTIDLKANVTVYNGGMPKLKVRCDANLLKAIDFEIVKQTLVLRVRSGYWIESGIIDVEVWVPYLTHLETRGWQTGIGKVVVKDIDSNEFTCAMGAGDIELVGRTNHLTISSINRTQKYVEGKVDATALYAGLVDAEIKCTHRASVYAAQALHVKLQDEAYLQYRGNPVLISTQGKAQRIAADAFGIPKVASLVQTQPETSASEGTRLNYISLKIRNNSWHRQNFLIKGPTENDRGFSYGFQMMPFATRQETIPVGTKIYPESGLHLKALLIVQAHDEGTIKDIFPSTQQ